MLFCEREKSNRTTEVVLYFDIHDLLFVFVFVLLTCLVWFSEDKKMICSTGVLLDF